MRFAFAAAGALVLAVATGTFLHAQDADRVIPGGGIRVQGWTGKVDAASARQGRSVNDAKFTQEGSDLHITTGPATTFWNPANTASGDYTVKATFREPKFMDLNSHPHSYGIFIGGNAMGTDQMTLLYCVTYGDGQVMVRGFGPSVFTLLREQTKCCCPQGASGRAAGLAGHHVARERRTCRMLRQRHRRRRLRQTADCRLRQTSIHGRRVRHSLHAQRRGCHFRLRDDQGVGLSCGAGFQPAQSA